MDDEQVCAVGELLQIAIVLIDGGEHLKFHPVPRARGAGMRRVGKPPERGQECRS